MIGEIDFRDVPWPWATSGSPTSGSNGPLRCGSILVQRSNKNSPYIYLDTSYTMLELATLSTIERDILLLLSVFYR